MHPHQRPFLFTPGTGDLWICGTIDGRGFHLEQLTRGFPDGESVWQWGAQSAHWTSVGSGQAEGRDAAIEAACAALEAAGIDFDQLPQNLEELAAIRRRSAKLTPELE